MGLQEGGGRGGGRVEVGLGAFGRGFEALAGGGGAGGAGHG